jgi:hypothetical protein
MEQPVPALHAHKQLRTIDCVAQNLAVGPIFSAAALGAALWAVSGGVGPCIMVIATIGCLGLGYLMAQDVEAFHRLGHRLRVRHQPDRQADGCLRLPLLLRGPHIHTHQHADRRLFVRQQPALGQSGVRAALIILVRFRTPAPAGQVVAEAAESTGSLE